ncbi:MAG: hypothetical protein HWN66_18955 [Candidatus Helarchaeota archaeon]|nr:hypothetical protein [Candidatus Helarchaeota archaeon]
MVRVRIPSTKASPEQVLDLIKIIKKNTGSIYAMRDEIHSYLLKKSTRGKRNAYNSVYAITFPTLRRLGLIDDKGPDVRLSHDGEILLKIYNDEGELEYKKAFGKILLRVDYEKAHVVKCLLSLRKGAVSIEKLSDLLRKEGVDTNPADDRLLRWLRYLKFVKFIESADSNIKVNHFRIKGIKEGKAKVKYNKFINVVIEEYNKIRIRNRGNIYVKIPELEHNVCNRLFRFNFTTYDFRTYLKKLKSGKFKNMKFIFSRPGAREENGITIDGVYYYYISIYR